MHTTGVLALGDPHRRAIVELMVARKRSVQELADALPISRPARAYRLPSRVLVQSPVMPRWAAAALVSRHG